MASAKAKCSTDTCSENQRSNETDRQRGNDQSQNFALGLDAERREEELNLLMPIDAGVAVRAQLAKADDDCFWYVKLYDQEEVDDSETMRDVKVLGHHRVGYNTVYIEITESRSLRPNKRPRITAHVEVPSHLLPPCERCLPIEDKSEAALRKLVKTQIRVNDRPYYSATSGGEFGQTYRAGERMERSYVVEDRYEDIGEADDIVWVAQDGHRSLIVAKKSLIGTHHPFLLFRDERARAWFDSKSLEDKKKVVSRLKDRLRKDVPKQASPADRMDDYKRYQVEYVILWYFGYRTDPFDDLSKKSIDTKFTRTPGSCKGIFECDTEIGEFFVRLVKFDADVATPDEADSLAGKNLVTESSSVRDQLLLERRNLRGGFRLAGEDIQLLGECPTCKRKPNLKL